MASIRQFGIGNASIDFPANRNGVADEEKFHERIDTTVN